VNSTDPVDLVQMKRRWLEVIAESESLVARLPLNDIGCLYLDTAGKPVCPNPDAPEFGKLRRHYGSVKGAWPRVVED
jgi:hypothetical protein